jgi:DNA polymerase lambda
MTFEDGGDYQGVLEQIVGTLEAEGLLTHRLTFSGKTEAKRPSHDLYAGVCRLPGGKHRRIDLKFYPRQNFAWALMHFTGSASFNRSLRLFAKKKGFRMSDEGYFSAVRVHGETVHGTLSAVCYTEADIFALFGIDYKAPEERDI